MHSSPKSADSAFGENGRTLVLEQDLAAPDSELFYRHWTRLSRWSESPVKRFFDCACVVLALPLLIPVLILIGLAVRLTSRGPVLFVQRRMGRKGKSFTILKFRTMVHVTGGKHKAVTTAANQRFTPIGPLLRRWKMDELPQVLNVLAGQMSLVGPRPKLPEHAVAELPCRPGITGAATIAFAREEAALAQLPQHQLDAYYHGLVLPTKHNLDVNYMSRATFASDLKLIRDTLLRRWDDSLVQMLLNPEKYGRHMQTHRHNITSPVARINVGSVPARSGVTPQAPAEGPASI